MEKLTIEKILEIKDCLKESTIKPYKEMISLRKNGFFQINSEIEYELLEAES